MQTSTDLRNLLARIDRKGYPAYKDTRGAYQFPAYVLSIDHVQGDPFAAPSKLSIHVNGKQAGFPRQLYQTPCRRIALQDALTRQFGRRAAQASFQAKGSGHSGLISISRCGQEVLERTACALDPEHGDLLLRLEVGFPANGRTINARELEKILFDLLPRCVEESLLYRNLDGKRLQEAADLAEDQQDIRRQLPALGLCAFVADGSILPRTSGVSSLPMKQAVPFRSPRELSVTLELPHRGTITGMGIPKGITLIVGGGYHGKSTLLKALELGVYDHIAGDGREYVITDRTAVKIRAEDGRSIRNTDISMFINNLPNGKDTVHFTTEDASGSTSQAAAVVESMEAGAKLFLIDEDTSATNFMVRDEFMQTVISRDKEPITPFIERTRGLYEEAGISTIMVAGSSGEFFYIADYILLMDCYRAVDITARVKELCEKRPAAHRQAPDFKMPDFGRVLPAYRRQGRNTGKYEHMKVRASALESFTLDKEYVSVRYLEQLCDYEQTTALGYLIRFGLEQVLDGRKTVRQAVKIIYDTLENKGWEAFCSSYVPCGLAKPRVQEVYAALDRFRF